MLVLTPGSAQTPVFLLEDRQTMWGSLDGGKTWETVWRLEDAERVERATECADGSVAVLTDSRLLSVRNLGSESDTVKLSEIRLEALWIS